MVSRVIGASRTLTVFGVLRRCSVYIPRFPMWKWGMKSHGAPGYLRGIWLTVSQVETCNPTSIQDTYEVSG